MSSTSSSETRPVKAPPIRARSPGTRKEDWIASQLQRVYDEALHEAIPQRMIDLLNQLDETDGDDGNRT
jgi:hypothetical protein